MSIRCSTAALSICALSGHRAIRYRLYFAGRGDVAAAVCSASASSLLGCLFPATGGGPDEPSRRRRQSEQVGKIMLQLLLPCVLGRLYVAVDWPLGGEALRVDW